MENRGWEMENGEWKMEDGGWRKENGGKIHAPYSVIRFPVIIFLCFLISFSTARAGNTGEVVLEPIVITAARMDQTPGEYGANITVLGAKEIAESTATDTAELISLATGVFLTQKSTSKTSIVDIRGFGDTADRNVLVLVNGRKINNVDNAAPDLLSIPIEVIERVEIIRGAGSVLYGDHAVGGVINIITKKGMRLPRSSIGAFAGSFGARKVFAQTGGGVDNISYYVSSSYAEEKGYRVNSDVRATDAYINLGYEVSQRLSFLWDIRWHEDHYGLPGGLNSQDLSDLGRRGSKEENNYADTTDRTFGFVSVLRPWNDPDIDGELTFDYSFRNQDTYGWYDSGIWGAFATKREIDTHAFLTKYTHQGSLADRNWSLVTGVDLYDVTNDILGSGAGVMASDDDLTISKNEVGVYGYGELEILPKLFAGTGLRYQRADYTFDQRQAAPQYVKKNPSETVKKGLLRYEYAPGSNVYASVEETFRFLSTDEWYNTFTGLDTTLQHQTGIQYELGWKHDFNGKIQTSVVPYWIENKNEIFFDPTGLFGANSNYDQTRRQGIELGSGFNLKRIFSIGQVKEAALKADYNYQRAVFDGGVYAGNVIPMAPRQQAALRLTVKGHNGLGFSLSERLTGSRYVINDVENQRPKEKAYFLTDVKVFLVRENWEIFAGVNNIFDREYNHYAVRSVMNPSVIDYYPAAGRSFEAGAKVKF